MSSYYGDKKIGSVVDLGGGNVKVLFKDQSIPLVLNKEIFEYAGSDKAIDLTELQTKRIIPVVATVLAILLKYDIYVDEIDAIFAQVNESINFNLREADDRVWGMRRKYKRMGDVDKVLRKNDDSTKESNKSN